MYTSVRYPPKSSWGRLKWKLGSRVLPKLLLSYSSSLVHTSAGSKGYTSSNSSPEPVRYTIMLCFVAIGYIYWLINTVLRLAFNSRTVLGKKLLCYADVLAYTMVRESPLAAALVNGMFVGLVVSIKSSWALIIKLWFSSFAKCLHSNLLHRKNKSKKNF